MTLYTRDAIIETIKEYGFTEYLAETIYNEQDLDYYIGSEISEDIDESITNLADEWWCNQQDLAKCQG